MESNFYPLKRSPFSDAPDPEFLFVNLSYKAALQALSDGIEECRGLIALIGAAGLGKTTLVHAFLETVDPQRLKTIYLVYPKLSIHEILQRIYQECGLEYAPGDPFDRINDLRRALIEEYKQGRNVALIIDEAQHIPPQTFEYLLILARMQFVAKRLISAKMRVVARSLMQVVLVGQPALKKKLNCFALQQFKAEHSIYTILSPLNKKESIAYIQHRISKASVNEKPPFTQGALKKIVTYAKGNPRTLNNLCSHALVVGSVSQKKSVSTKMARKVIADFGGRRHPHLLRWAWACALGLVLLLGFVHNSPYTRRLVAEVAALDLPRLTFRLLPSGQGTPPAELPVLAAQREPVLSLPHSAVEAVSISAGRNTAAPAVEEAILAVPTPLLHTGDAAWEAEAPRSQAPPAEVTSPVVDAAPLAAAPAVEEAILAVPTPLLHTGDAAWEAEAPRSQAPPAEVTSPVVDAAPLAIRVFQEASPPVLPEPPVAPDPSCLLDLLRGKPCVVPPVETRSQAMRVPRTSLPTDPASPLPQEDCVLNTLRGKPCAAPQQQSVR